LEFSQQESFGFCLKAFQKYGKEPAVGKLPPVFEDIQQIHTINDVNILKPPAF
jgi:hypothetical protein